MFIVLANQGNLAGLLAGTYSLPQANRVVKKQADLFTYLHTVVSGTQHDGVLVDNLDLAGVCALAEVVTRAGQGVLS